MLSKSKNLTIPYALIQFFFWFVYGAAVNFASVYLLSSGLNNTVIGLISAAACALSVLLQPLLASYADRPHSPSVKALLAGMTAVLLIFGLLLLLSYGKSPVLNGLFLGGAILLVQVALPFINALATETVNAGRALNFSLARGMGSIGYAAMSASLGALISRLGAIVTPISLMVIGVLLMACILLFPFQKQPGAEKARDSGSVLGFFRRYPAFTCTLAGCCLIYTSHVLINTFLYQIVVSKGGTSAHMGIAMALAGLLEVLSMVFFASLLKVRGCGFWFRISSIFFTLKSLATLLVSSMGALYAVQLIQPLGWGLMTVASVYHVNSIMAAQDRIKGQAYMTMTLSIGTIIGSLCGGWLIDTFSVQGMLIAAIVSGAVGSLIVLRPGHE